jgi:hypothetical protein
MKPSELFMRGSVNVLSYASGAPPVSARTWGFAHLENACSVSHFATAPAAG